MCVILVCATLLVHLLIGVTDLIAKYVPILLLGEKTK